MAGITIINEHIRTSSGPRFSTYTSDEERRRELIEYYNEVHCDSSDERLPDDAELEEVIEAIEEYEDVSSEEGWMALPKVFVAVLDDANGSETSVHLDRGKALEWVATKANTDVSHYTSVGDLDGAEMYLADHLHNGDWFVVQEKEIQA